MTDVACQKNVLGLGDSFFCVHRMRKESVRNRDTYMVRLKFLLEICDKTSRLTDIVKDNRDIHFVTEGTSFGKSP